MIQPWPKEAVIVVAPFEGHADPEKVEGLVLVRCRDCRAGLHADTACVRTALLAPGRRGRPVEFLCPFCLHGYDTDTVDMILDLAERKP